MLNKYFNRNEFACSCGCGFATADAELLDVLTAVRKHFNSPVTINSSSRCDNHNRSVGGADGSKHKLGIASDITVKGVSSWDVYTFLEDTYPNKYGIGSYRAFTHIDVRENKARW